MPVPVVPFRKTCVPPSVVCSGNVCAVAVLAESRWPKTVPIDPGVTEAFAAYDAPFTTPPALISGVPTPSVTLTVCGLFVAPEAAVVVTVIVP